MTGKEEMASPPPPPPLRFSSYSLLEGGDTAAGSLGLPTGALFAPFSELQPPPPLIPRQPVLCTFCAAYPSPFCRVDSGTGRWRCCFCERENPCYAEDFIGSSPSEHRESFPEMACKAVEYAEQDLSGVLSGLSVSALPLATGPHRRRDRGAVAPAHVVVVDGNMRGEALVELTRSMDQVLSAMDPEALISLVVFTGVVSVYRIGKGGAAVADVLPGKETLTDKEVDDRLSQGERDHFLPVRAGRETLITILRLLRGVGDGTSDIRARQQQQQQQQQDQQQQASNGGEGGALGRRKAWAARRRVPVPAHRRRRCLGAAVEYALRLARTADRPTARLLVCLGGCPNFGPGAVAPCVPGAAAAEVDPEALAAATDYFEDLGEKALLQGTGVDVFCASSEGLGAAALQGLVAPTSGYVVIQPSFGEEFAGNLAKSVTEQTMSDGDGLHGCVIDVRASAGVELLHVIGPAEATVQYDAVDKEAESASNAAARTAEVAVATAPSSSSGRSSPGVGNPTNDVGGNGLGRTHHRLVTGRVDPRTSLALYFDGPPLRKNKNKFRSKRAQAGSRNDESERDEAQVVFQFVVRRSSPAGDGRITRVVTHRLPVTDDGNGFLQTVDPEALAVLIGKEAVLRATFGTESGTNQLEVEEARVAVDTVVQEVSSRFRDFRKRRPGGSNTATTTTNNTTTNTLPSRPAPTSRAPATPLPAALKERGYGTTNSSDAGDPLGSSLVDAEGGGAGGFDIVSPLSSSKGSPAAAAPVAGGVTTSGGNEIDRPEDAVFPRELGRLPRQLFHLRRGPLLGPLLQNSDDPLCLRHLFLRGALEECLRMMEPSMVSLKATEALASLVGNVGGGGDTVVPTSTLPFARVPVETLAMLADRILVLDTHERVFVWSGADVCGEEFDPVREACRGVFSGEAGSRFPCATVVFLKDGTSWSRYLTSRLIPSHKDPVDDQLKGFPDLAGVPPAEVERLRAKLPPTDDESYRDFFWDVCDPSYTSGGNK